MCTPQGIIEHIGCLICDETVKKAIKAAAYVRHYKANLEKLEAEMRTLEDRSETIKRKVLEAEDRGEEVEDAVSHWVMDVDEKKQGVQELVGQRIDRENMHCFVCSCPNIKWRYRLGKLAEEKTEAVKELINRQFDGIAHRKPPPPELEFPSNENFVTFNSRTPILEAIMDALNDPKINTIGVHGPGGVGKTRLVEEVRKQMRENGTFKQVPLIAVSKNTNVKDIQSELAKELFLTLDAATDDKRRACDLWNKFVNGERYLVTLDDIWREVDLKAIGIPLTDGKTGCKVVLTSRNERLLKKMKVDRSFKIAELSELEAWALFKRKVGNSADSAELYPLASKVCKKCKGLPVAINALGAALEDKPLHAWQSALNKLESYMLTDIEDIDESVYASLRLTYDMLQSEDAKSCFLICCLFPEDAQIPIDDLMRHCMAGRLLARTPRTLDEARNDVHTVVDSLKSYSLLLDGREENVVRIHDVIREIGIKIARDEKAFLVDDGIRHWPETSGNGRSCTVISIRSGNIKQLPDELTYPQLHTLIFKYSNYPRLKVPDRFFSGMKELTVLVLNRMCLLPLPSSLAKLANLRMLCLNHCKLGDIKILGDLKTKLEVLSLRGSDIEALPPEIGQLTRLLLLDLRDCNHLRVIPQGVISKLTKLEELYIPDSFDKWEATTDEKQDTSSNVSLDELSSLTDKLTTLHIHIPDVMLLPKKQLKFENLKRFEISVGSMFKGNEKFLGTSILKLVGIPLKDEFMSLVDKAEELYLQGLVGLKKVLCDRAGGEGFLKLKNLNVCSCSDLEYLLTKPKSVSFRNLSVLVIQSCGNLRYLFSPSCTKGLCQLERLEIKSCPIEEIVGFDGKEDEDELMKEVCFSKLKYMKLQKLPKIISFYPKTDKTTSTDTPHSLSLFNEKVVFPALEELVIEELPQITQIFDKELLTEESFRQLREVNLLGCKLLVNVFPSNMLSRLQNLQELYACNCDNMEVIISMKGEEEYNEAETKDNILFPKLSTLRLEQLNNLKSFYSSTCEAQPLFNKQVIFPVLEELYITGLPNITEIWDMQLLSVQDKAESSEREKVMNAKDQVANEDIFVFSKLRKLYIVDMKNLKSLCTNSKISEAQPLFNYQVIFPVLKSLYIGGLPNITEAQPLFNHQVAFHSLKYLIIEDVPNITEIWDNQPLLDPQNKTESFYNLESIRITNCGDLGNVFPYYMLPQLQINLEGLVITSCPKVEVIVSKKANEKEAATNDIIVFKKLRNLGLENLKSFYSEAQFFFGNKVIFPVLESLYIGGLPNITEAQPLFNHQVAFPSLEKLLICDVPNITEIWDKQPLLDTKSKTESYKLKDIQIKNCGNLVNVFPYYMLPQLQINLEELKIISCPKVEVIVSKKANEKEVATNDIVVFEKLCGLALVGLENLKSFYSEAQFFFDNKVAFPSLKYLTIEDVPNITEIWDNQPLLDTLNKTEAEFFFDNKDTFPVLEEEYIDLDENLKNIFF